MSYYDIRLMCGCRKSTPNPNSPASQPAGPAATLPPQSSQPPQPGPVSTPALKAEAGAAAGSAAGQEEGLEGIAKQVFEMQNLARTQPKLFAEKLRDKTSSDEKEAFEFLMKTAPLPPLKWSPRLAKAAGDHANDIGSNGIVAHTGTDGSTMASRMDRYGQWGGSCGENCSFGPSSGEDIIIQLIVDEGTPARGHRLNIFSSSYGVTGIAFGPHKSFGNCCVLDYATSYTPN